MILRKLVVNENTFAREMKELDGEFEYNEMHGYEFVYSRQDRRKAFITEPGIKETIIKDTKSIIRINNDEKKIVIKIMLD